KLADKVYQGESERARSRGWRAAGAARWPETVTRRYKYPIGRSGIRSAYPEGQRRFGSDRAPWPSDAQAPSRLSGTRVGFPEIRQRGAPWRTRHDSNV